MYLGGELLVSVKVEGRQVHAFLDSGAGITVVDSTLPIGKAFVPTSNVAAQGATQKLRVGLGELPVVDLGDLHVEHLPTASVPIPSLEAFGDKRPEIVLGYTFFALGAVRVDYTKGEVVLAERAESLVEAGSRSVPMRVLGGKLVADVTIDGQPAAIELDTGNAGGIDLTKRWASAHGLPGTHKHVTVRGQFGAGASETDDVFFRLGSAALGPLAVGDTLAQISEEPGDSTLAGLAGNQIFARCDAVVFDHARRTLWLEGACTNPTPQTRFGWRLTRKDDPAFASTPWVVRIADAGRIGRPGRTARGRSVADHRRQARCARRRCDVEARIETRRHQDPAHGVARSEDRAHDPRAHRTATLIRLSDRGLRSSRQGAAARPSPAARRRRRRRRDR